MNEKRTAREVIERAVAGFLPDWMNIQQRKKYRAVAADAILAALADAGYAVVPVEPTDAMVDVAWSAYNDIWLDGEVAGHEDRIHASALRTALTAALAAVGAEPREEKG